MQMLFVMSEYECLDSYVATSSASRQSWPYSLVFMNDIETNADEEESSEQNNGDGKYDTCCSTDTKASNECSLGSAELNIIIDNPELVVEW
jgi:hypothetical protein